MNHREFRALFQEFAAPSWPRGTPWRMRSSASPERSGSSATGDRSVSVTDPAGVRVLGHQRAWRRWVSVRRAARHVFRLRPDLSARSGRASVRRRLRPGSPSSEVDVRYIEGLIDSVPALAALVVNRNREAIELSTGIVIEVLTAGTAQPRGRAYAIAIVEEAAFSRSTRAPIRIGSCCGRSVRRWLVCRARCWPSFPARMPLGASYIARGSNGSGRTTTTCWS